MEELREKTPERCAISNMRRVYLNQAMFRGGEPTKLGLLETARRMVACFVGIVKLDQPEVEQLRANLRLTQARVIELEKVRKEEKARAGRRRETANPEHSCSPLRWDLAFSETF